MMLLRQLLHIGKSQFSLSKHCVTFKEVPGESNPGKRLFYQQYCPGTNYVTSTTQMSLAYFAKCCHQLVF